MIAGIYFFLVSTIACAQQKEFGWLMGTWQETGKQSFEVWKIDRDFLSGESYLMKDGIKKITEGIKLIKKGNDFYYVPDVAGPQGPVEFKITSFNEKGFVAENPKHDFPTKISYQQIGPTQLLATISGSKNSISYYFDKIK